MAKAQTLTHEGGIEARRETIDRGTDNAYVLDFQASNSAFNFSSSNFSSTSSLYWLSVFSSQKIKIKNIYKYIYSINIIYLFKDRYEM